MTGLLLTHKRLNENNPTAAAVRSNSVYAYPTNRWRGTATSDYRHPHEANPISGLGTYNARCEVQRSIQVTLERLSLSFIPNNKVMIV